jgi:hypothetical protein
MRKISYLFAAVAALTVSAPSVADISPAVFDHVTLGIGGIEFTKSTAVRMAAEDLTISPEKVRVRYEFVNDTDKDVKTLVAFPLPDIDTYKLRARWGGGVRVRMTNDPENFVDFQVWADGKPVAVRTEQRAFIGTRDVTELIKAAGLPLNIVSSENEGIFSRLPEAARNQLLADGLLDNDRDPGRPLWVVRTKFYWTQRFHAHKTVVIEHSYRPMTGETRISEGMIKNNEPIDGVDYCFAAPAIAEFEAMVAARRKPAPSRDDDSVPPYIKALRGHYSGISASETVYILKTANSWSGPIGRFHLTLDKLKPEKVLSLCWDGELKKTGPTTYESTLTNFAPTRDIHMLVLE